MQMENSRLDQAMPQALRQAITDKGHVSYAEFIRIAAFDPEEGYYSKAKTRVGQSVESDFYTAESLGEVFGKLVVAASIDLIGSETEAQECSFVEIGAEPGGCVLDGVEHHFKETLTLRLGDVLEIPDTAIVFANEWLDAYPFHRVCFDSEKGWQELGVAMANDECLEEITLPELTPPVQAIRGRLPETTSEGYVLDLTVDATHALREVVRQPWHGAFLCFDYGKTWEELTHAHPSGTGRAYFRHQAEKNLLKNPGHQDLTCHLCWDFMVETLQETGFKNIQVDRQESFFMHRAAPVIRDIIQNKRTGLDGDTQTLMELLHPARMGDAFQALCAVRPRTLRDP